ncbi:MAG: hypothetical protein IPM18_00180 [Phycisphaerales bacterium]|nr:hypothetical protein [Phycisphaerales bacterium]
MARLWKPTTYKPVPAGAELVKRRGSTVAEWTDSRGRKRRAPVHETRKGGRRLVIESRIWWGEYRGADGLPVKLSTGCRDETAARGVLADAERKVELVRGKVLTAAELRTAAHGATELTAHVRDYLNVLRVRESRHGVPSFRGACSQPARHSQTLGGGDRVAHSGAPGSGRT